MLCTPSEMFEARLCFYLHGEDSQVQSLVPSSTSEIQNPYF